MGENYLCCSWNHLDCTSIGLHDLKLTADFALNCVNEHAPKQAKQKQLAHYVGLPALTA